MKRKILKITGIALFLLLAVVLAFAPLAARLYVNKNGKELTGRTLRLEALRINYLSFTVRAIGFKMYEKDDITLFAGFDTLLLDLQPLRLVWSELSVKRLWLVKPVATIVKQDTLYNFSDIAEFFSATDSSSVSDEAGPVDTLNSKTDFKFEIADIRLKNGNFRFTDKDVDHTTILDNLNFTIPYISWNQEESSRAGLRFSFRNGGFFEAEGRFDPSSGAFSSHISIADLDLSEFAAYVKPNILINSLSGLAACDLNITGSTANTSGLAIGGTVSLKSFGITDTDDRKILAADTFDVEIDKAMPLKNSYDFGTVTVSGPYVLFEMKDSSNNFIELFPGTAADSLTAEDDTLSAMPAWSLKSFILKNGSVDFSDLSLNESFRYNLGNIEFATDTVSSTSEWLSFLSTMVLNGKGKLKAEVGFNPSDPLELKADWVISGFQLTDISPYSKFYVGSPIIYGNLYYKGTTMISARQVSSQNRIVIRNAEIGKKSGGIFNIPLRLALYLIKDMNGDIIIDLPVSGNLNDPDVKFGPLVWKTFTNFIIKIAASPFVALSNLFRIDEKDLKELDFSYADTLLSASNTKKLDQLLMISKRKPELNIELAYFNDRALERRELSLLKSDTTKLDMLVDSLENMRIGLVRDYLSPKDSLGRIKIFVPNRNAVRNVGARPVFEIKFSMEE